VRKLRDLSGLGLAGLEVGMPVELDIMAYFRSEACPLCLKTDRGMIGSLFK
jgi:hypothetical protein